MVKFIEFGDIFNIDGVLNYAHGCNCKGAMGKGIAVQFKERFPEMYKEYKEMCSDEKFNLGDVFVYNYGDGYVFNLATQASWKTKADIDAVKKALEEMIKFSFSNKVYKIAMPKIGAGLGGLKWQDVKNVIENISKEYSDIDLFVVENFNKE